uniref:TIP41-like protein n=1 Tax=Erythrolobus madagascarensis TaxID=708628 RepID=A0A7S0T6T7_9RHOD|mmetsp:Transcript_3216/g.6985  ORF Transcript_3216/g.6985 Transcript_3216/m.6985 type:complete len:288 (+) Transcript_3216:172-1035(+)
MVAMTAERPVMVDECEFENDLWHVSVKRGAIASAAESEELESRLEMKLPGMVFPRNELSCVLRPQASSCSLESSALSSGAGFKFTAINALATVAKQAEPDLSVGAAEAWQRGNQARLQSVQMAELPHATDWTYTCKYTGSLTGLREITPAMTRINMEECRRTDLPIAFYGESMLYEDELDDHGASTCSARIRVMPTFMLVLLRFFLRIDGVLVRIHDTRFYHDFRSRVLVQHIQHREAKHEAYRALRSSAPQSAFGSPDQLSLHLPVVSESLHNYEIPIAPQAAFAS